MSNYKIIWNWMHILIIIEIYDQFDKKKIKTDIGIKLQNISQFE